MGRTSFAFLALACLPILWAGCSSSTGAAGPESSPKTVVYRADFSADGGWRHAVDDEPSGTMTYENLDSVYQILNQVDGGFYYTCAPSSAPTLAPPYAVQCDMTLNLADSSEEGSALLVFNWVDSGDYYLLSIAQGSAYKLERKAGGKFDSSPLIPWTESAAIRPQTETNTVKLVQGDSSLDIYINGTLVNTYGTGTIPSPVRCGLGVASYADAPTDVEASFANFCLLSDSN